MALFPKIRQALLLKMNKILICSPDEKTRESLKGILADAYEMILCEDVDQCLYILDHASIKMVILDIESQETLKQITSLKPPIKIYIIRNQSQKKELKAPLIAGYITKPFASEEILEICN